METSLLRTRVAGSHAIEVPLYSKCTLRILQHSITCISLTRIFHFNSVISIPCYYPCPGHALRRGSHSSKTALKTDVTDVREVVKITKGWAPKLSKASFLFECRSMGPQTAFIFTPPQHHLRLFKPCKTPPKAINPCKWKPRRATLVSFKTYRSKTETLMQHPSAEVFPWIRGIAINHSRLNYGTWRSHGKSSSLFLGFLLLKVLCMYMQIPIG